MTNLTVILNKLALLLLATACSFAWSSDNASLLEQAQALRFESPQQAVSLLEKNNQRQPQDQSQTITGYLMQIDLLTRLSQFDQVKQLLAQLAQANVQERERWHNLLSAYHYLSIRQIAKAQSLLAEGLDYSGEGTSRQMRMWFTLVQGALLLHRNDYEQAVQLLNEAMDIAVIDGEQSIEMQALAQLVVLSYYQGEYGQAFETLSRLEALTERVQDDHMAVQALVYRTNLELASFYQLEIQQFDATDAQEKQRLGDLAAQQFEKFNAIANKAIEQSQLSGNTRFQLKMLAVKQNLHMANDEFALAVAIAEQLSSYTANPEYYAYELGVLLNNKGISYREMGAYEQSYAAFAEAEAMYQIIGNERFLQWIQEDYALAYESAGNYQKAMEHYKRFYRKSIALLQKTNSEQVIELQQQFQNERNVNEIERLKQQNQLHTARSENERLVMIIGAILIALLAVVLLLVYYRSRMVSQHNRQLDELNRKLRDKSLRDPLTGLFNRRVIQELTPAQIWLSGLGSGTDPAQQYLGVVMIDIDHFKQINDQLGHIAGDDVLKSVAANIACSLRQTDIAVRWGGEEFLVLLKSPHPQGIHTFCQRLLQQQNKPSEVTDRELEIPFPPTVSVGFAQLTLDNPQEFDRALQLCLKVSDHCLYAAKKRGRNRATGAQTEQMQSLFVAKASPLQAEQLLSDSGLVEILPERAETGHSLHGAA